MSSSRPLCRVSPLAGLVALAALLVVGAFAGPTPAEAGPNPCPPDPPGDTLFFDCFDILNTDGSTDSANTNPDVDSANAGAWTQVETSPSGCSISEEELRIANLTGFVCTSVTSPEVDVVGYSQVTIGFDFGYSSTATVPIPGTFGVQLSVDGGPFVTLADPAVGIVQSTCDESGTTGNCADFPFGAQGIIELGDCSPHTLELRFTAPTPAESSAFVDDVSVVGTAPCDDTGDDPALPNISVTKVCVGEGFDATFEVTVSDVTADIECDGDPVTALDVDPGPHAVSETISGADAEGFATVIVCSDGTITEGTEATVTIPAEGAVDVSCVVINAFGEAADDLDDLFCSCTCCGGLDLEIDLNNNNNNTIGIDNDNANNNANANDNANFNNNENENKNDNQNENTQDQTNSQDQDNSNDQTNNITSSPEVNIDFDE